MYTYSLDCADQIAIGKENCGYRYTKMAAEHVQDVRFIVVFRIQRVVIWST